MEAKTTSGLFKLNWEDLGKGALLALIMPVLFVLQELIDKGGLSYAWFQNVDNLKTLGMAAVGSLVAYLIKNFFTPAKTVVQPPITPDKP